MTVSTKEPPEGRNFGGFIFCALMEIHNFVLIYIIHLEFYFVNCFCYKSRLQALNEQPFRREYTIFHFPKEAGAFLCIFLFQQQSNNIFRIRFPKTTKLHL